MRARILGEAWKTDLDTARLSGTVKDRHEDSHLLCSPSGKRDHEYVTRVQ